MSTVEKINFVIMCVFFLCYSYQFAYIPIGLLTQRKYSYLESRGKRVAVLIAAMCGCAEQGHDIVTCYRNSKNYGDNWISAGIGLWFLRESRYLNGARAAVGSSCAVSGTGFLFTRKILERCGGWHLFLLTEDIEFTIDNVTDGIKIGYCPDAVTYDEQPVTFKQSWRQRMRWSRGYMQVFARYGGRLLRGMLHGSFSCYDMAMSIMPAAILTGLSIVVNIGAAIGHLSARRAGRPLWGCTSRCLPSAQ